MPQVFGSALPVGCESSSGRLPSAPVSFVALLQHRALANGSRAGSGVRALLLTAARNHAWLAGQTIGWVGFALQIAAVAIAALSLVQSFAAGGLALSVPLAGKVFGHPIRRQHVLVVLLIAASLPLLPLGLGPTAEHLRKVPLGITVAAVFGAGEVVAAVPLASLRAVSSGLFYGAADAGIKAAFSGSSSRGGPYVLAGWVLVAAVGTGCGFVAFQSALRGPAITAISLMNSVSALAALAFGLLGFGESLGKKPSLSSST
jgi:hypothetical protein